MLRIPYYYRSHQFIGSAAVFALADASANQPCIRSFEIGNATHPNPSKPPTTVKQWQRETSNNNSLTMAETNKRRITLARPKCKHTLRPSVYWVSMVTGASGVIVQTHSHTDRSQHEKLISVISIISPLLFGRKGKVLAETRRYRRLNDGGLCHPNAADDTWRCMYTH